MLNYLVIYKVSHSMKYFDLNRYLRIKFQQINLEIDDYTVNIVKEYNVRECRELDFGDD